jgi:glycolate oxidase
VPDLPDTIRRSQLDASALDRLATRLPADVLRREPADLERHGHDETEDLRFPPEAAALPTTVDQVSTILRWAEEERVPVTPQGGRTGLSGGALPVQGGLALSLERLDRIRAIRPDDMRVEAEAGVVTARLQEAVAAVGLYNPPDPASREYCQLGGNLAEDSAGPHSCKYGSTRR